MNTAQYTTQNPPSVLLHDFTEDDMKARILRPDFFTDAKVTRLTPLARLFFEGLWCAADDEGRLVWSPEQLKFKILPADDVDVTTLAGELLREAMIQLYSAIGKDFCWVINFTQYQKFDHRRPSKLPPPAPNRAEPRRTAPIGAAYPILSHPNPEPIPNPSEAEAKSTPAAIPATQSNATPEIDPIPDPAQNKQAALRETGSAHPSGRGVKPPFQPPEINDIITFCTDEWGMKNGEDLGFKNTDDAYREMHKFIDHFQARGWKTGVVRMTDWRAAFRNWIRRVPDFAPTQGRRR